ncbi:MAG: flagellar biosynthetic protein FliP, partial [Lachnospiraceae bacterium]|nr:flagellar biosynthetic protein FliP [Lachnospiraceae bacterium]
MAREDTTIERPLTGQEDSRTNINEPGSSDDPQDLGELNVGNDITITINNGNGSLNGALRILIILTLISIAPFILVMLTSFTRIIVVLHFTRMAVGT